MVQTLKSSSLRSEYLTQCKHKASVLSALNEQIQNLNVIGRLFDNMGKG